MGTIDERASLPTKSSVQCVMHMQAVHLHRPTTIGWEKVGKMSNFIAYTSSFAIKKAGLTLPTNLKSETQKKTNRL